MKRIYKNNDLAFNLTINNFPVNKNLINSIEFKFYTLNQSNYILKTQDDIDVYNQVILEWSELRKLEEGVLFYDYNVSLKNEEMNDGTEDTVNKIMTNYYIVTGNETIDINSDMANYYTKDEIDDLIANVEGGEVDLTKYYTKSQIDIKLNGYVEDDVLGSYYTKNEVNDLIDNIEIPTTDLTNYYKKAETYSKSEVNQLIDGLSTGDGEINLNNYYTKDEVNNLIPKDYLTEIPSEFITETELNDKGYLTEHQSLENYFTKSEVNDLINNIEIPTGGTNVDLLEYYTKTEVNNLIPTDYLTSIPSEYITESELTAKGYLTEHQSLDNYYTKTEVDNKINNSGNFDSTQYYTKTEVNNLIPTDYIKEIPSEYITESELNNKGYLTQHQSLENYFTKSEVNDLIDNIEIPTGETNVDLSEYYTKSEIDEVMLSNHLSDISFYNGKLIGVNINGNTRNEIEVATINGERILGVNKDITIPIVNTSDYYTKSEVDSKIPTEYDDTSIVNRITALETELTGVSEQITELNNMVV